jgi:hypothetical protein
MATDSTGGTTLAKAQINTAGYPINGSGDVFIPHISQSYKIVLYKNATDADNDTTGNADWVIDNVPQVQTGSTDIWSLFSGTPTQTSATTFTLVGDQRTSFPAGTRVKVTDSTTLYGIVTSSAYTTLTTVTVVLDSGSLSGSLSDVYISQSDTTSKPISAHSISYNPLTTSAVNQTLFNKFNDKIFDVRDYGAVLDDTTNDKDALRAAINAAEAAGGGMVFIPGKMYVDVGTGGYVDGKAGVGLCGCGWQISQIRSSGNSSRTIEWQDEACRDVVIRDLTIDVNATVEYATGLAFDYYTGDTDNNNISVTNCHFKDSNTAGLINDWTTSALQFRNCKNVLVSGNYFDTCQLKAGGGNLADENILITGNVFVDANSYAISVVLRSNSSLIDVIVSNNICLNPKRGAIFVGKDGNLQTNCSTTNVIISGNIAEAGPNTDTGGGFVIYFLGGDVSNEGVTICDNVVNASTQPNSGVTTGIRVSGSADNPIISGNRIIGGGTAFTAHIWIAGTINALVANNICIGTGRGIEFKDSSGKIHNNILDGKTTESQYIYINGSSDNVAITDNDFVDCYNDAAAFDRKPITLYADTGETVTAYVARNRIVGTVTGSAIDEYGAGTITAKYVDNEFAAITGPAFRRRVTAFTEMERNTGTGLITENFGKSAAIASGATIAHGLSTTPTSISLIPETSGPSAVYATVDSTNITVNFTGGGSHAFFWDAKV